MDKANFRNQTINGFIWRLMQNVGTQIVNFVISIIVARILTPDDYGVMSIAMVFLNIANVIVQTGFTAGIIQHKNVTDDDMSALAFLSVIAAAFIYAVLFFASPYISEYYSMPELFKVLRVQSIILVLAAIYSVPNAITHRKMQFRIGFYIGLISAFVRGIIGIYLALSGYGVWALVYSNLAGTAVMCVLYFVFTKWVPRNIKFSSRIRDIFRFSTKLLFSNIINALYNNIKSLIIGKAYSSAILGLFDKGNQFPSLIMTNIEGSMSTVLMASLSKVQDEKDDFIRLLRRSSRLAMYVCAPLMIGLFAVAKPLVLVLLSAKWVESFQFVRIMSVTCLIWPLLTRMQAINAIGRSKVTLKINFFSVIFGLVLLLLTLKMGIYVFACSTIFSTLVSVAMAFFACEKYLGYGLKEQIKDILTPITLSVVMGVIVSLIGLYPIPVLPLLLVQIFSGIAFYIAISAVLKVDSYAYLVDIVKSKFRAQAVDD